MVNQLPAYLQALQVPNRVDTASANLGVGSPPYISIEDNRFTLVDASGAEEIVTTADPKLGGYVDGIIVDVADRMSKVFYDKPYVKGASQYEPPACWSDNGVGPSRNAARPQARTCAECPNSAWGSKVSAVSGKGIKACSDHYKIAIMIPGDDVIFLLRVPPNSLANFRTYVNKCKAGDINIAFVLTRMWFASQGTIDFAAINYIDEASAKRLPELNAAHATDAMIGRTDLPIQGQLAAPVSGHVTGLGQLPEGATMAPAPFVPAVATPSMPMAQPQQVAQQPAPTASPSEPARRRRRNTAEAAPQSQQVQAPFMPQPAPAPQPNGNFGMQQGAAPDPALQNTLNSLFGPSK